MSTPSTATITVPNTQFYPHSNRYLPGMTDYAPYQAAPDQRYQQPHMLPPPTYATTNTAKEQDPRTGYRQTASQASQYYDAPTHHTQQSSTDGSAKRRRDGPVDWEAYFGGKPPKEIIVIDDDEEEPSDQHVSRHGDHGPADKKRRTGTNTMHASTHAGSSNYFTTQRRHDESASLRYTDSTDRTEPYPSTAPTSLGSTSSNGAYADNASTGQKRKRSTRQAAAVDLKYRKIAAPSDPYTEYQPPPKPIIKAKDVVVPVIPDRSSTRDVKRDDGDGHYLITEHADLTDRYSIIKLLGQGTFGKVVKAFDRTRRKEVAIKIIRSVQKYRDASKIELRVLATLSSNDKANRNRCIHLRDTFDFRNHICIVTDLLGQSVFDFLKANSFVPFPSSHIQHFARQLFTSVAFLHDLNLIHTDLKPENILLVNNNYQTFTYNRNIPSSSTAVTRSSKYRRVLLDPEIRLIDFGSATFDDEYHSSVVSTRHYRAPEIILNLGWSFPCDIWSIGCILVEFFTGDALFQTHDNLEHLAMMEAVCDKPLDKMLVRQVCAGRGSNKNAAAAFFKRQVLDYPQADTAKSARKFVRAMKRLQDIIPSHTQFNKSFLDLLKGIFVYDPKRRITAHQALQHPWFREHFEDDGTEATKIRIEREKHEALRGYVR